MAVLTTIDCARMIRGLLPRFVRGLTAWALLLTLGLPNATTAADAPSLEYQIKAVFLFNFAQFVEWPSGVFPDAGAPLIVGVLGEDPFGPALEETLRGESIRGRTLVTRRWRRVEDIDHCHILFVSASETTRINQIVARLAGRPILTVGETEGFAQHGVMIRFVTDSRKIRLKINLDAARSAGLTLSSKLLRPAEIVTTGSN